MALIAAAVIGAAGAAYGAYSAGETADDQSELIQQQMAEAARIREENKKIANDTYGEITSMLDKLPGIESFLGKGEDIGKAQMDYRMKFILGDTEPSIRDAQRINASAAAFDFSDLGANLTKILRSSTFDIASVGEASGAPTGTFANLSVANMANLASQGLANTINIGDYLNRTSGIDQFNPYRIAQDLFTVERGRNDQKIQALNNKAAQITGENTNWFQNYSALSSAQIGILANENAAINSAVQGGVKSITGAIGAYPQKQALEAQTGYYNTLIDKYQNSGYGG